MEDLKQKLLDNAAKIAECRKNCLAKKEAAILSKEMLKDKEAYLLPEIPGKNQAERDANLRFKTESERRKLWAAETDDRKATCDLELALDERRLLESLLKINEIATFGGI